MDGQEANDLDLPPLSGALATPAEDHAMVTPGSGLPAAGSGGGKRPGECTAAPLEGLAVPLEGSGDEFDYPGCARACKEFVRAVVAYQEKTTIPHLPHGAGAPVPAPPKLSKKMERRRKVISCSFSLAKDMYLSGGRIKPAEQRDLEAGAEFLESNMASLSMQQEKRLKQMGATVRNASGYLNSLKVSGVREAAARALMAEMTVNQLSDLAAFYGTMGKVCSEVLDTKLQPLHVNVNLHD